MRNAVRALNTRLIVTLALSVATLFVGVPLAAAAGPTVLVAHRGVGTSTQIKYGFPEESLPAFDWAVKNGADIVDFDWPELGRFGEFDGRGKYLRGEYTADMSIEQIVLAEKDREDRIRRHRPFGVRWGWDIGRDPLKLHRHLVAHGFHPAR